MKFVLNLLVALALTHQGFSQDSEAPMITSISVTSTVDVTSGDQTVTATVQITDDDSGVDFGNLFLYRPDGNFVSSHFMGSSQRTTGDSLDGTYEVQMTVPQYAPAGGWEVRGFAGDSEGNRRNYGGTDEAFPVPADANFTVTNTGTVDTASPAIASVSVSPGSIDTGLIGQNITITLNITDPLTGLRSASLSFRDPDSSFVNIDGFVFHTNVTSGDAQDGVYTINSTIPQGSLDGTWTFDVFVSDQVGNRASIFEPAGATFEVNNTAGSGIGELPDAIDATQYALATSGAETWFPQAVVTNDGIDAAQSGNIGDDESSDMEISLTGPGTLDFQWKIDSEESGDILSVEVLGGGDFEEISGDVDWTGSSVTIPAGPQTVRFRYQKDSGTSEGADAGWVDRVCFSADSDQEAPVIQRISLSPNPVDISSGDGFVEATVTIEVSDDFNGFSEGTIYLTEVDSGNEYSSLSFDSADLISGDSKFGTYEIYFEFYPEDFDPDNFDPEEEFFFQEGTYQISAEVYDDGGESRFYGNGDDPFPIPEAEFFTIGGAPSGAAPFLTGISSITPGVIDVSTGDQMVTFEFGVVSNNSGLGFGSISLFNSSGRFVNRASFDGSNRISGNESNGTYSITLPIYQHSAPGTWFANFFLSDFDNNNREYPFDTDYPNPGEEEFDVINTGTIDTTNPVLTGFSMSPTTVDTTGGPQSISVNFSLTDDLSGIGSISLFVYKPDGQFEGSFALSPSPSGTLGNTFIGTFSVPMGSIEGTWNTALSVRDRAGNSFFYTGASLGFGDPFPAPFSGQFTVAPSSGTTFEIFTSSFGLTGADALAASNPDGDLFNNALEFLLGLNPNIKNEPNPAIFDVINVGNEVQLNFTIDPSLTITTNGNALELSNGGSSPVTLTGQTGATLQNDWVDQLPTNISGSNYRVTLPVSTINNGVIRLKFVTP